MILIEQLVLSWHQRVLNPVQEMTIKMLIKVKRVNHSNLWTFLASWDGIMAVQKQDSLALCEVPSPPIPKTPTKTSHGGGGGGCVNARDCYAFGVSFKSHKR